MDKRSIQAGMSWGQQRAVPGSVKPIYGAQYPPLQKEIVLKDGAVFSETNVPTSGGIRGKAGQMFQRYASSVSDVWDAQVPVDNKLASTSAAKVLERHAATMSQNNVLMPNCNPTPSKNSKVDAMQRLATQKEPIPGTASNVSTNVNGLGIYPRLDKGPTQVNSSSAKKNNNSRPASSPPTRENQGDSEIARFNRMRTMLGLRSSPIPQQKANDQPPSPQCLNVDLDELRKTCWMGIPAKFRPQAWRILSGYLPTNMERREVTLSRKREEYWNCVEQYFHTRFEDQFQDTFRQIHIDIPRMCPLIPLFQQKLVQEIFERILFIWAIRHPASGYVQGINDLVTPFFVVFVSEFIQDDIDVGTFDVAQLPLEQLEIIEADSFWCFSALLDTIQDNYTFAQPGIQLKVLQLKQIMCKVEPELHKHLESNHVEYLQFTFRWMNNVLMREIPLRATIRLWDTYLSERNGFSQFHVYVCVAFLRQFAQRLKEEKDFQGIMLLLQNLPTQSWGDRDIREVTAFAYSLMSVYHGAKNHLQLDQPTSARH
uniref:Rab-GAP TBC domain-containing protein n=1 Tax=Steinernema glaseri TaxID=37863 RepID=A0A1I7YZ90_9BILA